LRLLKIVTKRYISYNKSLQGADMQNSIKILQKYLYTNCMKINSAYILSDLKLSNYVIGRRYLNMNNNKTQLKSNVTIIEFIIAAKCFV